MDMNDTEGPVINDITYTVEEIGDFKPINMYEMATMLTDDGWGRRRKRI